MAEIEGITEVPATRDYVLSVLRDQHRQACIVDLECEPDIDLSFDTTIADWRLACDLVSTRRLGRALNESWGIELTDRQWKSVLCPARKRTLGDVTGLIASVASRPQLQPINIAGTSCRAAAAFLATRSYLRQAGADVDQIRPSSEIAEYSSRYLLTFVESISRIAPGKLPDIEPDRSPACPWSISACLSAIGAIVCLAFAQTAAFSFDALMLLSVFGLSFTLSALLAMLSRPAAEFSIQFGSLRTFRELAVCLSSGDACAAHDS